MTYKEHDTEDLSIPSTASVIQYYSLHYMDIQSVGNMAHAVYAHTVVSLKCPEMTKS
jgi:hypothetical protein